jgi:hypothetical protein
MVIVLVFWSYFSGLDFSIGIFCDPFFDYLLECEVVELIVASGALCYAL